MGHSNSRSAQTPGTHRSCARARAPLGCRLPMPKAPHALRGWGRPPHQAPNSGIPSPWETGTNISWGQRSGLSSPSSQPFCCSGTQNSKETRAPVSLPMSQNNVTWDLSSRAIRLDLRDRFPGGEEGCDICFYCFWTHLVTPPLWGNNNFNWAEAALVVWPWGAWATPLSGLSLNCRLGKLTVVGPVWEGRSSSGSFPSVKATNPLGGRVGSVSRRTELLTLVKKWK